MALKIRIIGVPVALGQSRRGVDMGPSALRVAGLQQRLKALGHTVEDIGNVSVKQPEEQHYGDKRAKYLHEIAETCRGLAEMTERTLAEGFVPLVLGGDHSIAVETVRLLMAGRARRYEHAGKFALGQHSRHAARGDHRLRRAGAGRIARVSAQGPAP